MLVSLKYFYKDVISILINKSNFIRLSMIFQDFLRHVRTSSDLVRLYYEFSKNKNLRRGLYKENMTSDDFLGPPKTPYGLAGPLWDLL